MSVIAGVLSKAGPPEPYLIENMLRAAPHRGACLQTANLGSCALGIGNPEEFAEAHLSSEGPMLAAFIGKLDNAAELANLLSRLGYQPVSLRAADIVVAAFRAHGLDAPKAFRGPFACIVTDGVGLWCFRDHLGLQPLFFRDEAKRFFVASEPKQIVAGSGIVREPNLEVLELLFYSRLKRDTPSALKGVERLPKTTILAVSAATAPRSSRYWDPTHLLETSRLSVAEVGEAFSDVFSNAISRALTGRDAVALSGGIDSPTVAAHAAPLHRKYARPLGAVSLVFPEHPKVDERRYIEIIRDDLGLDLHMFTPQAGPWDDAVEWCRLFDGPIETLSLPAISEFYKKVRAFGFSAIWTGDLAEAVFDLNWQVTGHLLMQGRWRALGNRIQTLRGQGASWRGIARSLASPFIPGSWINWYLRARRANHSRIPHWLDARKFNEAPPRMDLLPRGRDRWAALQLRPYLTGASQTLEAGEVCASLCGISIRRPFGDIDVSEFFLSLPAELKYPDGKWKTLMRRMMRGKLPDAILDRRDKTVFNDFAMSKLDYEPLRRFLINPNYRMSGVDYEALAARIERQDFTIMDVRWTNDLVRIHAFLSLWS